jgi:hypothetical protein
MRICWSDLRTMGRVQRILLRGKKSPPDCEESVRGGAESGVVVEASPGAALEVVEADLLFHLLIIALDPPAQLGEANEGLE